MEEDEPHVWPPGRKIVPPSPDYPSVRYNRPLALHPSRRRWWILPTLLTVAAFFVAFMVTMTRMSYEDGLRDGQWFVRDKITEAAITECTSSAYNADRCDAFQDVIALTDTKETK